MNTTRHITRSSPPSLVLNKGTLRILSDPYSPRGPIGSTTDATVSELIRWASSSVVSHAILYVGDGQVVEAVADGVIYRPLEQALRHATVAVSGMRVSVPTNARLARPRWPARRSLSTGTAPPRRSASMHRWGTPSMRYLIATS